MTWSRQRAKLALDSHPYHISIIVLVGIDLACVLTDLIIGALHCEHPPPHLEEIVEVLSWISISILGMFIIELSIKAICFRKEFLTFAHLLDVTVVVVSFILELTLKSRAAQELAGDSFSLVEVCSHHACC